MASKRYYWLKLDEHFFKSNSMKILRRMPYGYRFMIVYIEMMLLAINTQGRLYVSAGVPFDAEMLAVVIDMEYELIEEAIGIFLKFGLLKKEDDVFVIPDFDSIVGSETAAARKKRAYRQKTGDIEGTLSTDIDKEIEKEKETDIERDREEEKDACGVGIEGTHSAETGFECDFKAPSYEEVKEYALCRGMAPIAEKFYDHYTAVGWMMGKTPIKDWRAAFRKWEQTEKKPKKEEKKEPRLQYYEEKGKEEEMHSFDTDDFFEAALIRSYGYVPELE